MYRKVSKKGIIFIVFLVACIMIATIFLSQLMGTDKQVEIEDTYTIEEIIVENQILKVQLLDFVSNKNAQDKPTSQSMIIEANEEIVGVPIKHKQIFTKALPLQAPLEDDKPFVHENKLPSHNAYLLILVGDVVKYVNTSGEEHFLIENARIDYRIQTVLLEEEYNSLYILSIDGAKERMVQYDAYKQSMNNKDTYNEMLQW